MTSPVERGPDKVAGTQAISRAFTVLQLFRDRRTDLGVVEVSRSLGLTLSTAHRLVRVLVAEGYLAQNADTERYYLGRAAFLLGQAARHDLGLDAVQPLLAQLASRTGESVNLGLLDGHATVVALRVESTQALRFSQPPGTRGRLYATSMGKALLAFDAGLAGYVETLGEQLERLTPTTHATRDALLDDLVGVRARGWSTDDEESVRGVRCVAAPVLGPDGQARAAVAVQAPAVRMSDERMHELGPEVVELAKEIAALLPAGHRL